MIQGLTLDVAALQRMPETEPLGPSFVEGGLCAALSIFVCVATCLLGATCVGTQVSTLPEE